MLNKFSKLLVIGCFCIFINACVHGTGGGGDAKDNVIITSANEFSYGSVNTSCTGLAMLYTQNRKLISQGGSWVWKPTPLNPNSTWAGMRVMDWNTQTVQFLDRAIDTCVEENTYSKNLGRHLAGDQNSSYFNMSPSGLRDLINLTFAGVEDAKRSQQQATENSRIQKTQTLQRTQELQSGALPVKNLQDASLKYDAVDAFTVIGYPKIKPDGKNYIVRGYLEKYTASSFIGTTVPVQALGSVPLNTRFVVLIPESFQASYQNTARVGKSLSLIGKYVGNRNLELVTGASVTVPVFEAIYLQ